MKRKLQIMHDLFEIVQSYEPYTKIAIQENKLSLIVLVHFLLYKLINIVPILIEILK